MAINQEDLSLLQEKITAIRYELTPYMSYRNLVFNAEQMLELLVALPVAIGINLDKKIDFFEERVLEHAAKTAAKFYNEQLNEETQELFESLVEPDETMNDTIFVQDFKHELRYLISSFSDFEAHWLKALELFWGLEGLLKKYNPFMKSPQKAFLETMYMILLSNSGDDTIEIEQMKNIISKLPMQVNDKDLEEIKNSLRP
ncbi:MAG: hypothetical protein SFU27_03175 [Thermonemataceae bacterium]|nr:hypothetical protein [Thermonemataceae bacterium]